MKLVANQHEKKLEQSIKINECKLLMNYKLSNLESNKSIMIVVIIISNYFKIGFKEKNQKKSRYKENEYGIRKLKKYTFLLFRNWRTSAAIAPREQQHHQVVC